MKLYTILLNLAKKNPYPVGSIYMSINNTNPSTLFGGTWEQIKDTFLLSAGDTYTAGSTGGEATVQLDPTHYRHKAWQTDRDGKQISTAFNVGTYYGIGTNYTGANSNEYHNNMPPYLTVYMWKRTA